MVASAMWVSILEVTLKVPSFLAVTVGFVTLFERGVIGAAHGPIRGSGQLVTVGIKQREFPGLAD